MLRFADVLKTLIHLPSQFIQQENCNIAFMMYVEGVEAVTLAPCACLVQTRSMLGKNSTDSARTVAESNHF